LFGVALLYTLPFWTPFLFLAYAAGRRQFSLRFLFLMLAVEGRAITGMAAILKLFSGRY
jgi:hypothetical protein